MGITCSWLSEDFEPVEALLNLFHVPHPHTNLVIKYLIEEEILKWNLEGKITAITTDNDSNMVLGSRLLKNSLKIERISCAAHTLQLCVKKALNCDNKIKALLEALFNVQGRLREDYPKNLKPIHDVATRWNSTYNSWVRLLNLKKAIIILKSHMILDGDPEIRKLTTTLSGRDFVTLSLVVPLIFFLKKKFLELVTYYINDENYDNDEFENENIEPIDSSELLEESGVPVETRGLFEKVILTMYNSLNNYWSTPSSLAAFASTLDPHFKALNFFGVGEREEIKNLLKDDIGGQSNVFDDLFDNLRELEQGEFEKYFNLPVASRSVDPFLWWNERKNELPIMSKLARKYLCMSATSVPSECLFSDVGNHITPHRNRLSPDFISKLIFLKRNSQEINILSFV
ncbi:4022_t:CDS:2 [Entrophospora sp. SA101]|nr:4022_t:CDS:2 [Entrophospora sp. SA101]